MACKDKLQGFQVKVTSAHFDVGKKTYDSNVPTIVPKTIYCRPQRQQNEQRRLCFQH